MESRKFSIEATFAVDKIKLWISNNKWNPRIVAITTIAQLFDLVAGRIASVFTAIATWSIDYDDLETAFYDVQNIEGGIEQLEKSVVAVVMRVVKSLYSNPEYNYEDYVEIATAI